MKNINETNYLNVSKTPIYRRIMRCFYEERENLKYNLYREEIFEKIKKFCFYRRIVQFHSGDIVKRCKTRPGNSKRKEVNSYGKTFF